MQPVRLPVLPAPSYLMSDLGCPPTAPLQYSVKHFEFAVWAQRIQIPIDEYKDSDSAKLADIFLANASKMLVDNVKITCV